jgi:ethanolamine utilization protein EutN
MQIGRVVGDLSATQKHASHQGRTILLVQPLDLDGSYRGNPVVALDSVNAGVGDRVLLVQDGYAASTALGLKLAPIDAAVIGIVDRVELASEDLGPTGAAAPAKKRPKKQQAK